MAHTGINWGRGLFRIWLLITVLWVAMLVSLARPDKIVSTYWGHYQTVSEQSEALAALQEKVFLNLSEEQQNALENATQRRLDEARKQLGYARSNLLSFAGGLIGLPAILFALWAVLLWLLRGFRTQ